MKALIQRVSRAEVRVDGERVGVIGKGFVVLLGITHTDSGEQIAWLVDKIVGLRLFQDSEGLMNLSLTDVGGEVLVVSQFTLYGDARKGRRPSFLDAARPEVAVPLYEEFLARLGERVPVASGTFGAMMQVELVNDGPVTLMLER